MFLNVKEASDLTGKSATTIYRLCNKRRNSAFIKKEDNKFFIDKEFLLATYPHDEKRTIEIIENGSKETGEPVFLEIEPKQTEKQISDTDLEASIETKIEDAPPVDLLKSTETQNISQKFINQLVGLENEIQVETTIPIQNADPINKPFYHKRDFWERFIGFSITIVAIVSLLIVFYLNSN